MNPCREIINRSFCRLSSLLPFELTVQQSPTHPSPSLHKTTIRLLHLIDLGADHIICTISVLGLFYLVSTTHRFHPSTQASRHPHLPFRRECLASIALPHLPAQPFPIHSSAPRSSLRSSSQVRHDKPLRQREHFQPLLRKFNMLSQRNHVQCRLTHVIGTSVRRLWWLLRIAIEPVDGPSEGPGTAGHEDRTRIS